MTTNRLDIKFTDPDIRAAELDVCGGEVSVELLVTDDGNYNKIWLTKDELKAILKAIETAEKIED